MPAGVPGQSSLRLPFGPSNLPDAARTGDLRAVQRLLRRGQPVDAVKEGMTSLHWAVQGGHKDIVRALLEAGANPNLPYNIENQQGDTFEWSAIHAACKWVSYGNGTAQDCDISIANVIANSVKMPQCCI